MARIKVAVIALGLIWTLVLAASLFGNHHVMKRRVQEIASSRANAHFERDRVIRSWAGGHGGVYVPVSSRTQPNPALKHIPNRDFKSPDGRMITMMNPAYIIRQLNEDMSEFSTVTTHMISLKPLRPENMAEGWEREALLLFESGTSEVSTISKTENGKEFLNFMRPLIVGEKCLKCHGHQGYKVGDVRGGVAVSVPMTNLMAGMNRRWSVTLISHLLVWSLGVLGLLLGVRLLVREMLKRSRVTKDLEKAFASTEAVLDRLPVGVVLVGRDKIIRRINQTALDVLNKNEGEVLGHICHKHFCPTETDNCPILDLHTGAIDNSEKFVLGAEGQQIPVLKSVIPFVYQGENVLLEAFVDISERKESINRLTESMSDLRRFNRLAVDRELRMVELKAEINELLKAAGQPGRYTVVTASVGEKSR